MLLYKFAAATAILADSLPVGGDPAVTPEELLQALLDTRSPSGVISGDDPADSTRIRVLRALREGAGSAAELADRVDVSRQTVYRALDPCREAGLVRAVEAGSALTCSGGAVLRAYDGICEEIERTALVQLARSAHKRWILDALDDAPARKAVLATTARQTNGPSRTTVHRIIDTFVDDGYVLENRGRYELTEAGRHLLTAYTGFRSTIAQVLDKRDFLQWLPADLDSLPVDALADAAVIRNTLGQPHNVLSAFTRVADTEFDTFRGISTIVSPTLAQAYRPVLRSKAHVSAVFPDDVLFKLHQDPEFLEFVREQGFGSYIRDGFAARGAELLFVPGTLPLHLAICDDDRVMLAPAPSTGVTDVTASAIDSRDPRLVEWATTYFESHRGEGRPPLRVFLERVKGLTNSSKRARKPSD